MAKIIAPNREYQGYVGPVKFTDGEAETDNQSVIAYCRQAGYEVDGSTDNDEPAALRPEVTSLDPRNAATQVQGTELRDAAVDPREGDFLPPTNAGKEGEEGNPHGPNVVAPGIHAVSGPGPIVPGPVGVFEEQEDGSQLVVSNTEEQQRRETTAAEQVFIEQRPVPEVTAELGEEVGQPAPTEEQVAKDKEREAELSTAGQAPDEPKPAGEADDPAKTLDPGAQVEMPSRNDSKAQWETYARSQGATDEEIESSTKADLIKKYGGSA